jgi:UDP-GlcNAc:undecaprenyl-phosphate/decaprenyl-phosphate GlcNAc-1-phosphate transferase
VSLLLAGASAAVVAALVSVGLMRTAPDRLVVVNHRGRRVPAVLGVALVAGMAAGWVVLLTVGLPRRPGIEILGAVGLVATAGILDDVAGHHARGFRGHFGSLARGQMTTGILKLVVGLAVAVVLAVRAGGDPVRIVASAVLIVVSINLWNAMDVAPGRALKAGVLVLAAVLVAAAPDGPAGALAAVAIGAALTVLPFDLAERGMLGDAGSNPLGLLAGLALVLALPTWAVVVAAWIGLVAQVAAETVTLSRLIEAVPPLRWLDRAGRRR